MPPFRAHLREILCATLDVTFGRCWAEAERGGAEAARALVGIPHRGLLQGLRRDIELEPVRLGQPGHVEKGERLAAGIVQPADEDRILRNHDAALAQRCADTRIIQHLRDGARIRAADSATARAAIVRGFVRVVHAGGAVAEHDHEPRESLRQPDVAKQPLRDCDHLIRQETMPVFLGSRLWFLAFDHQLRRGRGRDEAAEKAAEPRREPRENHARHQRDRRKQPECRREKRAADRAPAPAMKALQRHADPPPRTASPLVFRLQFFIHRLRHPMLRLHHDRAQRDEVRRRRPAVIHGHAEETRGAKRLGGRRGLLDVTPD